MRVIWLAWYICGVCLLLALLASAITYHPDIQHLGVVLASRVRWRGTPGGRGGGRPRAVAADAPRPPVQAALGRPRRGRCHRDAVAGPGGVKLRVPRSASNRKGLRIDEFTLTETFDTIRKSGPTARRSNS